MLLGLVGIMTPVTGINLVVGVAKTPLSLQKVPNGCQVMGRSIIRITYTWPGVTVFFDEIERLLDMTGTGVCASPKLCAVAVLFRHRVYFFFSLC